MCLPGNALREYLRDPQRDEQQHLPVAAGKLRERPFNLATRRPGVDYSYLVASGR
jgi:hypothetical protein